MSHAQIHEAKRWKEAGWSLVTFPPLGQEDVIIGDTPVFLVNATRDLIFIDLDGHAFEIEPFLKEFVRAEVRPASEARPDHAYAPRQGRLPF